MKALVILLLAGIACQVSARIGETRDQLVARYGQIIPGMEEPALGFQKNGIFVTATMWNGVCHGIVFKTSSPDEGPFAGGFVLPGDPKPDPKTPEKQQPAVNSGPLTKIQVEQLLTANGGGAKWIEKDSRSWKTADGKLFAYFIGGEELHIQTAELLAHKATEEEKTDAKKTEGF